MSTWALPELAALLTFSFMDCISISRFTILSLMLRARTDNRLSLWLALACSYEYECTYKNYIALNSAPILECICECAFWFHPSRIDCEWSLGLSNWHVYRCNHVYVMQVLYLHFSATFDNLILNLIFRFYYYSPHNCWIFGIAQPYNINPEKQVPSRTLQQFYIILKLRDICVIYQKRINWS